MIFLPESFAALTLALSLGRALHICIQQRHNLHDTAIPERMNYDVAGEYESALLNWEMPSIQSHLPSIDCTNDIVNR